MLIHDAWLLHIIVAGLVTAYVGAVLVMLWRVT